MLSILLPPVDVSNREVRIRDAGVFLERSRILLNGLIELLLIFVGVAEQVMHPGRVRISRDQFVKGRFGFLDVPGAPVAFFDHVQNTFAVDGIRENAQLRDCLRVFLGFEIVRSEEKMRFVRKLGICRRFLQRRDRFSELALAHQS